MRKSTILALSALAATPLSAAPAPASEPTATQTDQTTAPPVDDQDKRVCRSVAMTGSIMPKRICMSKKLWAEIDAKRNSDSERAMDARGNSRGGGAAEF